MADTRRFRADEDTWLRFRIAAMQQRMPLGALLARLLDEYDRSGVAVPDRPENG